MKGIDPKYIMWLGLAVTIEQAIGHGTVSLTNIIPASWAPYVTAWCNLLAFIGTSIMTYQAAVSGPQTGPLIKLPDFPPVTPTVVKILIVTFALSFLVAGGPANAQKLKPLKLTGDLAADIKANNANAKAAITGQPADPKAALPCMDIRVLFKLTPDNILPTAKACWTDANNQLVSDTQRALTSAQNFKGSPTGNSSGAAVGDNDAINCLTPALALFQAAAIIPAVPAVLNADGSVKTPEVPEQDPGPILLYQKYREFTLAGALTSCQAWFNGPINATVSAGAGAVGTALGGAAVLSGGALP
jgi:hypothetical protein